jgi:hypothetical protein
MKAVQDVARTHRMLASATHSVGVDLKRRVLMDGDPFENFSEQDNFMPEESLRPVPQRVVREHLHD